MPWFKRNSIPRYEVVANPDAKVITAAEQKLAQQAVYEQEQTAVQLRIMRTHIAAQADQLSTLLVLVQGVDQRLQDADARMASMPVLIRESGR